MPMLFKIFPSVFNAPISALVGNSPTISQRKTLWPYPIPKSRYEDR